MDTLSRREEDTLLKATKAQALKDCDELVKSFAECATGRTVSVAWACRTQHKQLQACITCPENMDRLRAEYVRLRRQPTNP
ncbi:cytochrome C oxidase biogenesis Cmc1-like protein [Ceratobasidium sp. AG-Ba]|nr:cytochrome C oxidase biogenesis Cmc1-like protein [Ceratobasidium sp. AG-Ba]QRV88682.1 cytochrome C oxidase biogenesis Cmc1-like protein [Ceratobasidium sp. AG-Ba]QRW02861.1 cytochrome C oxidase biogenesis Cmc1-like protein [Ceratobasidium sp. AG-Ba]